MTPSEIKSAYCANSDGNRHFFDRGTMKWFGDRMSSFGTRRIGGAIYLYRKANSRVNVFGKWQTAGRQFFNAWYFDQQTGDLHNCNAELTETIFKHIYSDTADSIRRMPSYADA